MSKSFQGKEYLPVPTTTSGPIALETSAPPVKKDHRIKKVAGLAVIALLVLVAGFHGAAFLGREPSKGLWGGQHTEGHHHLHHHEQGIHVAGVQKVESYLSLPTISTLLSTGGDLTLGVPAHSASIVVHLEDDSVDAQLSFINNVDLPKGTAAQILVEKVLKGEVVATAEDTIKVIDGADEGVVGIVLGQSATPSSYLITISLSSQRERGPPVSFFAHGASLSLPDVLDVAGFKFNKFSLKPASEQIISIKNLHANKGKIVLAGSGSIVGSFNVSEALILKTEVGDVFANVSIHAPHHKKHDKDASWKKNDKIEARHDHHHSHDGASSASAGDEPHDGPPPRGPPGPGEVKVIVKNTVGQINLQFVDEKISKFTRLHAKAFSDVAGSVQIGVVPGFKGVFLEKSANGQLTYENPSNTEIKIVKNIVDGPGGLVKGLVGPHPPWNHTEVAHEEGKMKKNGGRHQHHEHKEDASVSTSEHPHHHSHHHGEAESATAPARAHHHHSHGEEDASSTSASKHHHQHEQEANLDEKHNGPSSGHDGPAPPPGFGFVGGFVAAGSVDIVFL